MGLATVESQYLEGRAAMNCADATAAEVDEEVRKMLESCYEEAKRILSENLGVMDVIAAYLIKEETITGEQFMKLYRREKGIPEPEKKQDAEEPKPEAPAAEIRSVEEPKAEEPKEPAAEPEAQEEGVKGRFSNVPVSRLEDPDNIQKQ